MWAVILVFPRINSAGEISAAFVSALYTPESGMLNTTGKPTM